MYVDSFVLTDQPAKLNPPQRRVKLGEVIEGHFVVDRFPAEARFGVYLEVAFEGDEAGDFELSVVAEAGLPGHPHATLHTETLHVVPPSEGWWAPRIIPLTFEAIVRANGELDAQLLVEIDGDDDVLATKAIFIRLHPAEGLRP